MPAVHPDEVPVTAAAPEKREDEPIPATQVEPQRTHRRFSPEQRRQLLTEYDALPRDQKGPFLRSRGLYASTFSDWRKAASRAPSPGPDPRDARIAQLERELAEQALRTRKAEALLELQKKVAQLVETFQKDDSKPR